MSPELIIIMSGDAGGISSGYVEPPDTTEYMLNPDGSITYNPDGSKAENPDV